MEIVKTFGHCVEALCEKNPACARALLCTGWRAQNLKFRYLPDRRLTKADQYLARIMMDLMLAPLQRPEQCAMVSIFTPCELVQEAGLSPYNVEAFSCYLAATYAEQNGLRTVEDRGLPETLCSYHRTFLGAAETGLLPKPRCIVYTSLACDANLVTFRHLADLYRVPSFSIDVPYTPNDANVTYVAGQLRELAVFLRAQTGTAIDEDRLRARVQRGRRTLENYDRYQTLRADRYVPSDLVSPMYCAMTNSVLLGTEQEDRYVSMLLDGIEQAPPARGTRIYWMHTIPFWSDAVKEVLMLREEAQIVGCELAQMADVSRTSDDPYEAMAQRLVYSAMNGGISRRIAQGIRNAKQAGADGVVWFNHWGCKHTLGGSALAKKQFEAAGLPFLILDGDGCDRSHGGEGQTATRLGAFLELLEEHHA